MDAVVTKVSTFVATEVMSLLILLSLFAFTYVFTLKFNNHISKTLSLFLDIDNARIKKYINRCEQFTITLNQRESDDNDYEEGQEGDVDTLDRALFVQRKRRRNKAVKLAISKMFFIKFGLSIVLLGGLLLGPFLYHYSAMGNISVMHRELNTTSIINPVYHQVQNT